MNYRTLALPALFAAVALCICTPFVIAAEEGSEVTPGAQAVVTSVPDDYRVAEEDVLRIDVWGEPQLMNQQAQVTPDGKIDVAFVGSIEVAGLTIPEVKQKISERLEEAGILYDAQIQVTLINMHQPTARVLGEVMKPGAVVFKDGDTILDAIAQAGSYTNNAWLEKATLTHKNSSTPIPIDIRKMLDGDLTLNYPLQKGDTIYIPPEDYANKIYVLGYVMRPGIYDLKENTTVLSAISLAGGPVPERGALGGTTVVRGNPANPERVPCDLTRLFEKADLTQDIVLQPGDVVVVPETKKPNWDNISRILGTIINITYIRRYGLF